MTFNQWLRRQRKRQDPIGDIARESGLDRNWPRGTGVTFEMQREYLRYVRGLRPSEREGAIKALVSAYTEFGQPPVEQEDEYEEEDECE